MREEKNARVRERFELSLDGRQIASIVVGALVILGVVFVLGLNVGRQIATRQVDAARAGDLEALDRPPSTPSPGVDDASLTFHDRLVKQKPPATPPVPAALAARPASAPAEAPGAAGATPTATPAAAPPAVTVAAAVPTSTSTAATPSAPPPAPKKVPEEKAESAKSGTSGAFTIQIGATQQRPEADRIAARYRSLRPRVETADVQGKGRWYRVRVGSFETREAAERYRKDVARETGVPGFVTASR